ncbi:MAG: HesA/MoeB/ThiF family protein [Nitrososphaerota archaeon]|jgi:adenylyltransferase/sulfurtransferase|nr:HesA/MoeB/ThiF family protein [Nitrososphaerota archaeon]
MDTTDIECFAGQFYSRQIVLKELGAGGQEKLLKASVAVVGIGGLGSISSLYLALAGVGCIRVIDQDILEPHNLHRQILYTTHDLCYPKAEVAAKQLQKHNPLVVVEAASENLNEDNAERLLQGVDVVVDGLDNMPTRYLVNRTCIKRGIPYVFGAAIGLEGHLSVFQPPQTGCLECLMPNGSGGSDTCDTRGIIGATAGTIGNLQALETIKLITGTGKPLRGKLLVCDFTDMNFTTIDITENPRCPVCHGEPETAAGGERLVWFCGKDTANINPQTPLNFTLDKIYPVVQKHFEVRLKSQLSLMFTYGNFEVSLFGGGRMLIKGVKNEETALKIYREILQTIAPKKTQQSCL